MTEPVIPVVVLGVRSQDEEAGKDSAGDQVRIVKQAALSEPGRFLYAEHVDHGSGFRGNRGKETQAALDDAKRAAAEYRRAELWVFKSERLARGSGRKDEARSVLEVYVEMRRFGVDLRSKEDDAYFTNPMLVGVADAMAHKYADDLSAHVRRGLAERKDRGQPVGPLPLGYRVKTTVIDDDHVVKTRVIDSATVPVIERIFEMVERGETFGAVARALNAEGVPTKRGGTWLGRTVREIVRNPAYAGEKGYDAIIDPERWHSIQDGLRRLDPAAVQRRKGGRKPTDPSFWLRGTVFCLDCGAALYTRTQAAGRVYICSHRRQSSGLCRAEPIPAALIEGHVLDHLEAFVGDVETWLAQQAEERDEDRHQLLEAAQRLRDDLDEIDRRRRLVLADYETAVADSDPKARIVLEVVAKLDTERETLTEKIEDAEAAAAEWEDVGDSGLQGAVDLVRAIGDADTAEALNAALSRGLAGIYARVTGGRLRAEFRIAADAPPNHRAAMHVFEQAVPANLDATRIMFPEPGETVRQTLV